MPTEIYATGYVIAEPESCLSVFLVACNTWEWDLIKRLSHCSFTWSFFIALFCRCLCFPAFNIWEEVVHWNILTYISMYDEVYNRTAAEILLEIWELIHDEFLVNFILHHVCNNRRPSMCLSVTQMLQLWYTCITLKYIIWPFVVCLSVSLSQMLQWC